MQVFGYLILRQSDHLWLADDECKWTSDMDEAAVFSAADYADHIGTRECSGDPNAFRIVHILENAATKSGDVNAAIEAERKRCVAIINAAREGEIDADLRSIRARIDRGDQFPEQKEG